MLKLTFAAILAGLLALSAAPARSAEAVTPNDTARFLAGLPPDPGSPLAAMTNDPVWQQHARYFDRIFAQEDKSHLSRIRAFADARLTPPHDTMLYMFGGPDFLHATEFYPKASNYILAGLEPVGDVPPLNTLPRGTVDQSLHSVEASTRTLLTLSFFITKNMKTQLVSGRVFGTLPILYVFLARTGKTVHETSFVNLDDKGEPHPASEAKASLAKGVKIVFSTGDRPKQTLYYFSTNLANDGARKSGFLAFCATFGEADALLKSASYLLHSGGFTTVRTFLLDHASTIVQDDSGIPLAAFDRRKWQFQPFGRYLGPIGIFPYAYQSQMAELYRRDRPIPLDFGLGYRWRNNESNLLLARKVEPKSDPKADPKPEPKVEPKAETRSDPPKAN
jgi:hypothetical protein